MNPSLKQLYNKLILERQKSKQGFEKRENAEFKVTANNPVCGDRFTIYFDIREGLIQQASYHGYGCALSKAATSLLVDGLTGKSTEQGKQFIASYLKALSQGAMDLPEIYRALAVAKNFPGREQCTTLSWKAVSSFIENINEINDKGG